MNLIVKGVLGFALALAAAPVAAAEDECVAKVDPTIGQRLTDQFFYEEGLNKAPAPYGADLKKALDQCIAQYDVSEVKVEVFKKLNVATAMKVDIAKRLRAAGTDVAMLDRGMAPHIPSVSTTYDEMFDELGPEFEKESARLGKMPKVGQEMADALLGSYTGAFHSAYVAQLEWDALR